jgi:hypothetical protein
VIYSPVRIVHPIRVVRRRRSYDIVARVFFRVDTFSLGLVLFGVLLGAIVVGAAVGRRLRARSGGHREPIAVMQAAMLGFMALVLAFGLSLAVGRYEDRRAAAVTEANAIGTTYLRAQTLSEPVRTRSLGLLERFAEHSVRISHEVPGSPEQDRAVDESRDVERELWALADQALIAAPEGSAARLYVESLNEMLDAQTSRVAGLANRVPTTVLVLEVAGAAMAIGILATHLAILGRGLVTSVFAAGLVGLTLFVIFDLDRPTRGFIQVPSTALDHVRDSIQLGPTAEGPGVPG